MATNRAAEAEAWLVRCAAIGRHCSHRDRSGGSRRQCRRLYSCHSRHSRRLRGLRFVLGRRAIDNPQALTQQTQATMRASSSTRFDRGESNRNRNRNTPIRIRIRIFVYPSRPRLWVSRELAGKKADDAKKGYRS